MFKLVIRDNNLDSMTINLASFTKPHSHSFIHLASFT